MNQISGLPNQKRQKILPLKNSYKSVQYSKQTRTNSKQTRTNSKQTQYKLNQNKEQKEQQPLSNNSQKPTTIEIEIPITLNWIMPIKSISNTIKEQNTSQKRRSKQSVVTHDQTFD